VANLGWRSCAKALLACLVLTLGAACSGDGDPGRRDASGPDWDDLEASALNSCLEAATPEPCGLDDPGEGLEFAAAVEFPQDDPAGELTPFDLTLIERADGREVGVFTRPADAAEQPPAGPAEPVGSVGPDGLEGVRFAAGGQDVLLAARGLDAGELSALATKLEHGGVSALGTEVAVQEPSWVPGMGSLPVPSSASAFLTSYTSQPADGQDQSSIGVGSLTAGAADARVLGWWFGNAELGGHGEVLFTSAAYDAPEGQSVPDARLTVAFGASGSGVIFRSVGLSDADHDRAFRRLAPVRPERWGDLVAQTRARAAEAERTDAAGQPQ
jgi:hypothetical protein